MVERAVGRKSEAGLRAAVFRELRMFRRMRPAEVAQAMAMRPRTYEHFESGMGRLNVTRVRAFAEALNADPHAICAALAIKSPAFAARAADNKLVTVFLIALQEFDATTQDAIATLDAYALMDAFTEMFDRLGEIARAPDGMIRRWRRDDEEEAGKPSD